MEMARDEVRVMTVHGAKGLEAPIVILADTTTPPQGFASADACCSWSDGTRHAAAGVGDGARPTTSARWATRAPRRSTRRATNTGGCSMSRMTRAIERLIVCGVDGEQQAAGRLLVRPRRRTRSTPHCVCEPADDGDGEVRRYRKVADTAAPPHAADKRAALELPLLPPWLSQNVTADRAAAPIKPSGFVDDDAGGRIAGAARGAAARASCAAPSCTG